MSTVSTTSTKNTISTTIVCNPSAKAHFGTARVDITPPAGIYHPMWGAARHHRATGIHRPLMADVMIFAAGDEPQSRWVQAQLDMVGLGAEHHAQFVHTLAGGAGVSPENVVLAYSHTHSGGLFLPNRTEFPGGELILPYLEEVNGKLAQAARAAVDALQPAGVTFAYGRCNLAANRDYWDQENNFYACGYNPDAPADDTVLVARFSDQAGDPLAVLVNYACHPTTLAWENTQISPDYVGALRATVEDASGVPCIFTLGPCGDLGPRRSHLGDTAIADANGRQLAYAVLATLEGMDPPEHALAYQGPVISGATLGTWAPVPLPAEIETERALFGGGAHHVDLPQKPVPDAQELENRMHDFVQKQQAADAAGDEVAARNYGAFAERARRWLGRLPTLSSDSHLAYPFSVRRMGQSIWVALSGEPYNWIQTELRRLYPQSAVVCTVLAGEMGIAYLLPADRYGAGLYQEEPSILDQGCLEQLLDAVRHEIEVLLT